MKKNINQDSSSPNDSFVRFRSMRLLITAFLLVMLIGVFRARRHDQAVSTVTSTDAAKAEVSTAVGVEGTLWFSRRTTAKPAPSAEEIVADKLAQFTQSRRKLARLMAKRKGVAMPDEVERFFDILESGNWEEIATQFATLSKSGRQYDDSTTADSPKLDPVWNAVLDAYGAAEQVHEWPAQKLLDYGNAILDSLRPGMVYVGGTDNGRWVPELLNETSGGEYTKGQVFN